jgi:hypothetical protein
MPSTSLLRRGLCLEYATLGWNVVGTVIILIAGVLQRYKWRFVMN